MTHSSAPLQKPQHLRPHDIAGRRPIMDRVRSYVAVNFLFQDELTLAPDASMLDAGILDSLGVMELVAFLEDEFAISVDEDELVRHNLDTLAGVTALVRRHLDGV